MTFEPGKKYYAYQKSLGLMEVEFVGEETKNDKKTRMFKNKQGNVFEMVDTQLDYFKPSKDEAFLYYFLSVQELYIEEIERKENDIKKYRKKLYELQDKYSYLKEIYPEEFI